MAKNWYYIFILMIVFSASPAPVIGSNVWGAELQSVNNDINIYLEQNSLRVTGAEGLKLEIFNVAGIMVVSENIDGVDKRFSLDLPRGCYIVKVGKLVKKISVK